MFMKLLLICLSIALSRKREWLSFMCTCMGSVLVDLGSCISYCFRMVVVISHVDVFWSNALHFLFIGT